MFPSLHVLGRVEARRVSLTDNFLRLVAVQTPCALVPQENGSIEALADDGILGRCFKNISDEIQRLLRAADDNAVEKLHTHRRFLRERKNWCVMTSLSSLAVMVRAPLA